MVPMMNRQKSIGFTLIELLIVVAIIAILAAIAVPNFLEAQTRAKVGRVKADMRTVATAVETYRMDYNCCPALEVGPDADGKWILPGRGWPFHRWVPSRLSTPVSYITNLTNDPFDPTSPIVPEPAVWAGGRIWERLEYRPIDYCMKAQPGTGSVGRFYRNIDRVGGKYVIMSYGPDRQLYNRTNPPETGVSQDLRIYVDYDPSNGTVSIGNVIRSEKNGALFGTDPYFYGTTQ